jgi:hypothetical protein
MKTADNIEDKDLQDFFAEMKAKDNFKELPEFPKPKQTKIWQLIPIGIAASLALIAWFYMAKEPNQKLDQEVIIITLEEGKNNELQFRIETTTELESWESSTSSLLTEF